MLTLRKEDCKMLVRVKETLRCLLVLPMLMLSLAGQASTSEYIIGFGTPVQDKYEIRNANGALVWTYSGLGVNNLIYSVDTDVLSFTLQPSGVIATSPSLRLTSAQTFSGIIKSIHVLCSEVSGLTVTAYVGQVKLGELERNLKTEEYLIGSLSYGAQSEAITLVFTPATGQQQQQVSTVSVTDLSKVVIYVDDAVVPLYLDQPVTFDPSVFTSAVLSNYSYQGILLTLNESGGDGFEDEDGEGVIYLESTLTDDAVESLANAVKDHSYAPGDPGYAVEFAGGITLMVPKGKGFIQIEAENEADYAYHVKIGEGTPVEVGSTTRKWLEVPYEVNQDTYVYIYMVRKTGSTRAGTRIGRRATAHGKIYVAKCAGCGVMGDADNNGTIDWNDVKVMADYIMGQTIIGFSRVQANLNGDDDVNVADLVKLIRILAP